MDSNYILFSQLIALIHNLSQTNNIKINGGDLAYRTQDTFKFEGVGHHSLSIKWDRGEGFGPEKQFFYMTLDEMRDEEIYHRKSPVLHAYLYKGDNCNTRTRFLYKIMANNVDIVDDLGIVGHGGEIGKTSLTKLKAGDYLGMLVNQPPGATVVYKKGWVYQMAEQAGGKQ